jgi:hypothetical protein
LILIISFLLFYFFLADMRCAAMDRSAFERLLGPIKDIMERQINEYRTAEQVSSVCPSVTNSRPTTATGTCATTCTTTCTSRPATATGTATAGTCATATTGTCATTCTTTCTTTPTDATSSTTTTAPAPSSSS